MKKTLKPRNLDEVTLTRMNIGRRYWSAEMTDFPESTTKGLFRQYISEITSNYDEGWGIFLYGGNGVGKTHASCALLKEIQRSRSRLHHL